MKRIGIFGLTLAFALAGMASAQAQAAGKT